MKLIKQIILLFFLNFTFGQLSGNFDPKINLTDFPYTVSVLNTKHGLSLNHISAICKLNNDGYLISNYDKLYRYNGISFDSWDFNGNLNIKVFTKLFSFKDAIYGFRNTELYQLKPKFKFISTCAAVFMTNGNFHKINVSGGIIFKDEIVYQLSGVDLTTKYTSFIYRKGKYYIGTNKGLFIVDLKTKKQTSLLNENIRNIKIIDEKIFILTDNNIYTISETKRKLKKFLNLTNKENLFNDILRIDEHYIITSHYGIYIINTNENKLKFYNEKILPVKTLGNLIYDKNSECILISSAFNGLIKLQKKRSFSIYSDEKYFSNPFLHVLKSSDNKLYTISQNNVIQIDNNTFSEIYPQKLYIYSIFSNGTSIFVGNINNNVTEYDHKFNKISEFKLNCSNGIYLDKNNFFWVLNGNGVLHGKSLRKLKVFLKNHIHSNIVSIYEKANGDILLGGENKFYHITSNQKNEKKILKFYNLHGQVRSFFEISANKILIGTNSGGLYYLNNNNLINISRKKNCYIGNEVFTLAKDKFNNLIMSSNSGLKVISLNKLIDFINNKIDYLIPYKYDETKGIYNTEFNGGFVNNYATIDSINFYFPSAQGIVKYKSTKPQSIKNRVSIDEIKIDDRKINSSELKNIHQTYNEILIKFSTINLADYKNLMFQYKLEKKGQNKPWNIPQKENFIKVSQLGFGEYALKIRCIDASNEAHPIETSLNFEILPNYYETPIFIFISITTIIVFIIAFTFFIYQKKKKEIILRNNLSLQIKDAELRAIHSQMNPHFIFNMLQSINNAINKREYNNAEIILINFSKLLRLVLEKSDKLYSKIQEEIEFINLYIQLQNVRLNYSLDFSIECNKNLYDINIPTMIIQPIVENAIIHGLFHKNKSSLKKISISIQNINSELIIKIIDNGIGINASKIINKSKNHKSKGYELLDKKITLVKSKFDVDISYSIIDLSINQESGTKVELKITNYDKLFNN